MKGNMLDIELEVFGDSNANMYIEATTPEGVALLKDMITKLQALEN